MRPDHAALASLTLLLIFISIVQTQYISQFCASGDFRCDNGKCILGSQRCNKVVDCPNEEDEKNCDCSPEEFRCPSDGSCIETRKVCDGISNCPDGADEQDCDKQCPPGAFQCRNGACAERCNGRDECDDSEDELNCDDCVQRCDDNVCVPSHQICDGHQDCYDATDEEHCARCDRPDDFRCGNDDCISKDEVCNGVPECSDGSDEFDCYNKTVPVRNGCKVNQFQCRDGSCINIDFQCDRNYDCLDRSDEENCAPTFACDESEWQCASGQCIEYNARCDGVENCNDRSDEENCYVTPPPRPTTALPWTTTQRPWYPSYPRYPEEPRYTEPPYDPYRTTAAPVYTTYRPVLPDPGQGACRAHEWRCENGPCIDQSRRCDGRVDCLRDSSDEFDCPPGSPVALNLKTYPDQQTVRHGGDVVFQCRDEGLKRAPVRWVREGGRPLKHGYSDKNGRLELNKVTLSDSGVYICQAVGYLGNPGGQVRVELVVQNPSNVPRQPSFPACTGNQATCGDGQCILKSAVCDGKIDCRDGSDEDTCHFNGQCEPNQFKCKNRKCVLKSWRCDSEDDCGDNSDEENCYSEPGSFCRATEFKCSTGDQCVFKSFHCDGQSDCQDGSDEIGCAPIRISRPPAPANVRLNPGESLELVCEAVGVPMPLISWRLNWGHVPEKCRSTSENGIGKLSCPNMQPEDSGAYSCEALNYRGTVFATPDSIVSVNRTDVCSNGFFNSEARSAADCIRCFCFGESTTCKSADLFTYNMPTPLGEGGTRLVGISTSRGGEPQLDSQPITDSYYYQSLRNGASVTKLDSWTSGWSSSSNAHPYITLPETYNGNQLTSYGGHIKYTLIPHSPQNGYDEDLATVIIIGKYGTLVHYSRAPSDRYSSNVEVRLTPENWQKASANGLVPATREDLMMALDNIELVLLRADLNNAGVNITNFAMESAQLLNSGLGIANLVEECSCPPGYEGLSCQKCASGYRRGEGPWLGPCVREEQVCPPGTYGDPASGSPCRPCPCPHTTPGNQFARTCGLASDGKVTCNCPTGYGGRRCEYCQPGYSGNPLIPGDSCVYQPPSACDPAGTLRSVSPDRCLCKDQVQGTHCDVCKPGSFYLSQDFRHGCALCFCSGVSQQCRSSNLRRKTTAVRFNTPHIIDQLKVFSTAPQGLAGTVKYKAPVVTEIKATLARNLASLSGPLDTSRPTIYYWSLPPIFAGDKVTSYGGFLRYTLRYVRGSSSSNNAADVQLISENRLTFHYFGNFSSNSDEVLEANVQFLEKYWHRSDGKEIPREQFLLALADVKTILVKATYSSDTELASLESASIETAESGGEGPPALHVEQCTCPAGYIGTSCEDCAPGYTRSSSGLYLEHCAPCDCNQHSSQCDRETGRCYDCADNTAGDNCELCADGYEKDSDGSCVPIDQNQTACKCDPRGSTSGCDLYGNCDCKQNVEGRECNRCRQGTFGLSVNNPQGCLACYCSGVTSQCREATHLKKQSIPGDIFGERYGGYTITDLNSNIVINDQFIAEPNESKLTYIFSFPPTEELYWSLPFTGNKILSYGGTLGLKQSFDSREDAVSEPGTDVILVGESISIYWSNPSPIRAYQQLSFLVPLRENGWFLLNSRTPARRQDLLAVLADLKRVLVRATLTRDISSTSIADVEMVIAMESDDPSLERATGVEECICPEGYRGTSCESCTPGYYKDQRGRCVQCNCNGYDCQLDAYDQVVCNCRPPHTGPDCSIVGGGPSTEPPRPAPKPTINVRIISPTIKIHAMGSSVNFTCESWSRHTSSAPPVSWRKDGGYLPQDRSIFDRNSGWLHISNLQPEDSGTYICYSTDGVNNAQASTSLQVERSAMTKPSVTLEPADSEHYEDDRVELNCIVSGNPTPTIYWQRADGAPLPVNNDFQQQTDNKFVIERARIEDTGEYRCIASNVVDSVSRTAFVRVRPRPGVPRGRLTVSTNSATVAEGQDIRIVCTGTHDIPADSINWVRRDGNFESNVRSENGVLTIERAVPENQGVYLCQSLDFDGMQVATQVTVESSSPSQEPYELVISPEPLKLHTGGRQSAECTSVGNSGLIIKWEKFNATFGPGVSQRDNHLIINNAQEEDGGYYRCDGLINGTPVVSKYLLVEIERRDPPRVEIWPPGELSVALGSPYEIRCQVLQGTPEPAVTWDRNGGRQLSQYAQIQPHNVLRFESVRVNDDGEYTCTATNEAGTHSASTVLKVRAQPEISINPAGPINAVQGERVRVECRGSGVPDPMVSIKSMYNREVVPPTLGVAVLDISSVSPSDDGQYECIATSPAGTARDRFSITTQERGDVGFGPDTGSGTGEEPGQYRIEFEGKDIILSECQASPGSQVIWSKADRTPLPSHVIQQGQNLYIRNALTNDSGDYECSFYDPNTNEEQSAAFVNLRVVRKPKITLYPETQTVRPGASPQVQCIAEGDDIIEVTWRPINRTLSSRVKVYGSTLKFDRIEVEDAGQYECVARSEFADASAPAKVIVESPENAANLIMVDKPSRPFRVGDNVEVLCRSIAPGTQVEWVRIGNNQRPQYVETRQYGDGSRMLINGVEQSDAGTYRCTGRDAYGGVSYDDFVLEVQPVSIGPAYPISDQSTVYTAKLGDIVDLPCRHNLEQPVQFEWKREYAPLPPEMVNEANLHLEGVTETDAGTYTCRVWNSRVAAQVHAILRVVGVVPQFNGESFIALPAIKDAYHQFDIEISFKPNDQNGLILYNSQFEGRSGKYLALHMVDGVPQFLLDTNTNTGPIVVNGDRPLALNVWHTIRVSRTKSKVTMDVDNQGPIVVEPPGQWGLLEVHRPLYIGGVPDYNQLPGPLAGTSGFIGCISMLILGREEKNIMVDAIEKYNVDNCDSCSPNPCQNDGVCQEARTEVGYTCLCASGFAGPTCARAGEACRPGLCGPGKCSADGYKCSCPIPYTGRRCEIKQSIEFPAFAGSAYLAIQTPNMNRVFRMSMKIKASAPVSNGIIMYCAESPLGFGAFMSLAVHDGKLELRNNVGDRSPTVVLTAHRPLAANDWTQVNISRVGHTINMKVNQVDYEEKLSSSKMALYTPLFVGGVDDSIVLNNNTGVTGGFNGCVKDVTVFGETVNVVNSSIQSANVQECSNNDRGDIPEENYCNQCRNGGYCQDDQTVCTCPAGFSGPYCEYRERGAARPCDANPCLNGHCRVDYSRPANYSCDCNLPFAGTNCQIKLDLIESVGFNGNGYLELPANLLNYDNLDYESVTFAVNFYTTEDGVLLYQRQALASPDFGDYVLLRVESGRLVFNWDYGSGASELIGENYYVSDGRRHSVIVTLRTDKTVSMQVDHGDSWSANTNGITSILNADSNVYVGGIPDKYNLLRYPGLTGCIVQVELMDTGRGVNLGANAVAGRNVQRCRDPQL